MIRGVHLNETYIPGGEDVSVRYDPLVLRYMEDDIVQGTNIEQILQLDATEPLMYPQEVI